MAKKAVVFGASGQLGVELCAELRRRGYEVAGYERVKIDVTSAAQVESALASVEPQVDVAEQEPRAAYDANALAVRNLAVACRQNDARLVHFSTDYVFDGRLGRP